VVAGTATAVSGAVAGKQAQRQQAATQQAAERQQLSDLQEQVDQLQSREVGAQLSPAAPAGGEEDLTSQLSRLGDLHRDGVLTADEFAAAKARLLGL
jgi:hypothetical protein